MKSKIPYYFLISISLLGCKPKFDDEESIIQLLEKESFTWRAADIEGHADCWHIQPYSKILISNVNGLCVDVPPNAIVNPKPEAMGSGGYSRNSNYKMSIQENNAWVSHDEVSTARNGVKTYSHEIRLLEKINGNWKLVGQTIHVYKTE